VTTWGPPPAVLLGVLLLAGCDMRSPREKECGNLVSWAVTPAESVVALAHIDTMEAPASRRRCRAVINRDTADPSRRTP
jgi:hypothetical protein